MKTFFLAAILCATLAMPAGARAEHRVLGPVVELRRKRLGRGAAAPGRRDLPHPLRLRGRRPQHLVRGPRRAAADCRHARIALAGRRSTGPPAPRSARRYDGAVQAAQVGTATIEFADAESATLHLLRRWRPGHQADPAHDLAPAFGGGKLPRRLQRPGGAMRRRSAAHRRLRPHRQHDGHAGNIEGGGPVVLGPDRGRLHLHLHRRCAPGRAPRVLDRNLLVLVLHRSATTAARA